MIVMGQSVLLGAADLTAEPGGDPRFLAILDHLRAIHLRKVADYGRGADPLANLRASEDFGIPAWKGTLVRLNDKMHRLKSFCLNGELKNESFEDSLIDLASYAILALVLYREHQARLVKSVDAR